MPRDVRLLLFGQNHWEIDLKGSFYELIRRLGLLHTPDHLPLPTITDLRTLLTMDPYIATVESICPGTIKQLPLRVINSTAEAAFSFLRTIHEGTPGSTVVAILNQLWQQTKALTDKLLPHTRPAYAKGQPDSAFRMLEQIEVRIVEDTIRELTARYPVQSTVWLHDGFLICPAPAEAMLRHVEAQVLVKHQLFLINHGTESIRLLNSSQGTSHDSGTLPMRRPLPLLEEASRWPTKRNTQRWAPPKRAYHLLRPWHV